MEHLEKEWESYPVLHIDFSISKYLSAHYLRSAINWFLERWERDYGCCVEDKNNIPFSVRLSNVIESAYKRTGKPVVVLVDEYDSPMLDTNSDVALQNELRGSMSPFKTTV